MANVLAATMGYSTGYADVDAVLAKLLAGVRGTLGPELVGVYLDGSLATGDFVEHSSDIDVLVVTEDALSDEVVAALGTMHARLATGTSKWARELEVSYIPRRALRRFDPDNNFHPCIQRGSDQLLTEEHDRAWVIHRHVVRERGVALVGPDPRTLIDPVDVQRSARRRRESAAWLVDAGAHVSPVARQSLLPIVRGADDVPHALHAAVRRGGVETDRRALGASGAGRAVDAADPGGARLVE